MSSSQSLDRINEIIDVIANNPNGCSLSDVVINLNLPKTTAHRNLNALVEKGFLMKGEGNLYKLGYKFLILAKYYLGSLDIRDIANPYLKKLVAVFNVTAHIAIMHQNKAVYIEKIRPFSFECAYSDIGKTIDLYCSGLGKSLLLGMDDDLKKYLTLAKFDSYTSNTLDSNSLKLELEQARKTGYTIDNAEHEDGMFCIAAPIYDYKGNIIAAISVSSGDKKILNSKITINSLLDSAKSISKEFGYTK